MATPAPSLPHEGLGEGGIRHSWMLRPRASLLHPEPQASMGAGREQKDIIQGSYHFPGPQHGLKESPPSPLHDFICYLGFWQEPAQLETSTFPSPSHLSYPSSHWNEKQSGNMVCLTLQSLFHSNFPPHLMYFPRDPGRNAAFLPAEHRPDYILT